MTAKQKQAWEHLDKCGPLCRHVTFCDQCTNLFGLCARHRSDPRASIRWKPGVRQPREGGKP